MPHDIFISYSTENADWANALCELIESNGFHCWMAPRDICPGANWGAEIVRGINEAKLMMLLLSTASNHSRQVAREVQLADSAQLGIIPILLEAIQPEGDFLYFIGNTQWLTAIGGAPQSHAATLLASVRTELANATARPAPDPAPGGRTASPQNPDVVPIATSTGSSAAAAQPALTPANPPAPVRPAAQAVPAPQAEAPPAAPQTPVGQRLPAATAGSSKTPWLWIGLGAAVVIAAGLWFAFFRTPAAPLRPPITSPAGVAFNRAQPWNGTFQGDVGKNRVVVHIREESGGGHHSFTVTVDDAISGREGERAIDIELERGGRLTFVLGEEAAPRAQCMLELTSDKQHLIGAWHQLKADRTLRVDFERTAGEP